MGIEFTKFMISLISKTLGLLSLLRESRATWQLVVGLYEAIRRQIHLASFGGLHQESSKLSLLDMQALMGEQLLFCKYLQQVSDWCLP